MNTFYVIVRFNELGPVSKNMAVYYNGFKVGKVTNIEPDNDYKHTLVTVNLNAKNLKLPQNTTVQLKSFPSGELFLQLVYPSTTSLKTLSRGDTLEGISPYNLEEFMLGQNVSGVTDIVSIHVIKALDAMGVANMEMENFFKATSGFLKDNKAPLNESAMNIAATTKSLAGAAENLNQVTAKLNHSIDTQTLKDTTVNVKDSTSNIKDSTLNIQESTQNIKETTENINKATKDLDKTMKKVDDTVSQVNSAAANINCITGGLNQTLSKRFGGMRVIFGTPVKARN
jgi:ABC-type transporter Mla subunit MlaD